MTSREIQQRMELIDQFGDKVVGYCVASLLIVITLLSTLVAFEVLIK